MKVLIKGHRYEVINEEGPSEGQIIQFIQKATNEQGEFETVMNGTTNEELLRVLIDRMNYLQKKLPCKANAIVITKLEESLMWLNRRTDERSLRGVEGTNEI